MSIRVGIVGISGFGGGEAMRLIASHPEFELVYAAGEGSAGSRLVDRFPGVPPKLAVLVIEKWDPESLPKLDVLFASLPTGASAEALARVSKDVKIVDIGGDHRYVAGWAYGMADVWPEQIIGQTRVANPGCFPAATLTARHCDLLGGRHAQSGAPFLLSQEVDAAVINAGDGMHEHPTQALLDALTIRRRKGRLEGLVVAICGDVAHSRVARSNMHLLTAMGSRVRAVGPRTLVPAALARFGVEVHHDMKTGLEGADIVMTLRLQRERMARGLVPSEREYFRFFGLDAEKLAYAAPDALVMHPGPMNRGVEIDSTIADHPTRSLIREQVEMGVAVRMAVLDTLSRGKP